MTTPSTRIVTRPPNPPVPRQRIVLGKVNRIDEAYTRSLRVPTGLLIAILAGATVIDLIALLLAAVLRIKIPVATRPGVKELRKGPEFVVTPLWVHDADGSLVEIEVHGYLAASAVIPTDRIRATVHRQKGRDALPRVGDLENLTTSRRVRPRGASIWLHFGVPLVLQAVLGAVLLAAILGFALIGSAH